MSDTTENIVPQEKSFTIAEHAVILVLVSLLVLVGNTVGPGKPLLGGFIGLAVLYGIVVAGLVITRFSPIKLPSIAWISLVGILLTVPGMPGSDWVIAQVTNVDFLALATPCLAYAGFAVARREIDVAKSSGWKILVVGVLVLTGTYLGSAIIAQTFL